MRLAIISDLHGNLTALEAVLGDLEAVSPDLILHGGDLAAGGARPREVVERVHALGWQGVLGNTDEMLYRPEALAEVADRSPRLERLFAVVGEMADFAREALGEERLVWLESLPMTWTEGPVGLVHASPESAWNSPGPGATDLELESAYQALGQPLVVYAHIHHPFVRHTGRRVVANTGAASLSYDGDPRASYLLIEDGVPTVCRVAYDLEAEARALRQSGLPHAEWVVRTLQAASFLMPA